MRGGEKRQERARASGARLVDRRDKFTLLSLSLSLSPFPPRWKAAGGLNPSSEPAAPSGADTAAAGVTEGMAGLAVAGDGAAPPPPAAAATDAAAAPAAAPPKKPGKKKKGEPEVVLEITARGRKKSVTIISGERLERKKDRGREVKVGGR